MTRHSSNPDPGLCEHLVPGPYPFETVLVLDDHLGPTELLIRCRQCDHCWLLEMLDWREDERLFRIRKADPEAVAGLLKDLARGSCDLRRAGEQARHFSLTSERLPELLLLNVHNARLSAVIKPPMDTVVPGTDWRALACDGSWIRQLCG